MRNWKCQAHEGEEKRDCPILLVRNKKKWKINAEEIGKEGTDKRKKRKKVVSQGVDYIKGLAEVV